MTVCGVGLIGGSLALIARRAGVVGKVVGLGRSQANLDVALDRGMIDLATRDPVEAARGADLMMLAVPIQTMPATLGEMIAHLRRMRSSPMLAASRAGWCANWSHLITGK